MDFFVYKILCCFYWFGYFLVKAKIVFKLSKTKKKCMIYKLMQ